MRRSRGDYTLHTTELHLTPSSSCTILANADKKGLRNARDAVKLQAREEQSPPAIPMIETDMKHARILLHVDAVH